LGGPIPMAEAQQLNFNKTAIGNQVQFSYRYRDNGGLLHQVSFYLSRPEIERALKEFQTVNEAEMRSYVMHALYQEAAKFFPGIKIDIAERDRDLDLSVEGSNPKEVEQALNHLQRVHDKARDSYLTSHFYTKDKTGKFILPDHGRIAARYVSDMAPVAASIRQGAPDRSQRGLFTAALNFVQSIPYDTLQNRETSNGAGFTTPIGLLQMNRGDCDTKAVALTSLLRTLLPGVPVIMVYVPDHVFIGARLPTMRGDRVLSVDGEVYILAEPAGPSLVPAGQLAHASANELDRRNFTYIKMP
ncbi:MAG: hypothetical protein AB7U41_00670, partial [Dongiaceae bacterium]